MDEVFQWMKKPEIWGIALGVVLPLVLTIPLVWWARGRRAWASLTSVNFFLFDINQRFIHIIGPHTYMPDDGDSFDIFHHRLLDRTTQKIYQGGEQRGASIELDSQFIQRTTHALESYLSVKLEFLKDTSFTMDSDIDDSISNRPVCFERPWFESDTTKPKPPPRFGIIFREYDGGRDKFKIEVFANHKLLATHEIKGSFSSFKGLYDTEKRHMLFTYSHGTFYRIGICILDMHTGQIILKKLVKPDIKAG